MRCGGTPEPVQAPPAVVFDDVTKGYVPWSMSRKVPCAPSNKMSAPLRICSCRRTTVFCTNGLRYCPALLYSANTCLNDKAGQYLKPFVILSGLVVFREHLLERQRLRGIQQG